jgi:hypothetical protein
MEDSDWELLHSGSPQDRQRFFEKAAGFLVAEAGEHWACLHPHVVQELLWLWQFSQQPSVQFLRSSLARQAAQCSACAAALHRCRTVAVSNCAQVGQEGPSPVERALDEWDIERLTAQLEHGTGSVERGAGAPASDGGALREVLCAYLAVLLRPAVLADTALESLFVRGVAALMAQGVSLRVGGEQPLPGLFLLAAHRHDAVRGWARGQLAACAELRARDAQEEIEALPALETVLAAARDAVAGAAPPPGSLRGALSREPRAVWTGLLAGLRRVAPWVLEEALLPRVPELPPLLVEQLLRRSPALLPAALILELLLQARPPPRARAIAAATFRARARAAAARGRALIPRRG